MLKLCKLYIIVMGVTLCGCQGSNTSITEKPFGFTAEGKQAVLYTLVNKHGMEATITNYGAIIVSLKVPDRNGKIDDVTLGYSTLDEYIKETPYFGAIVGRYGNRIAKGKFTLDGQTYTLATNNNENHLHGGDKGFDKVIWHGEPKKCFGAVGLQLTYHSVDGEEGYPGNLLSTVTYYLTNKNEIKIIYNATTDQATPVNLTHHSYFNLAGQGNGDILGHEMMINANRFTPVDSSLIPTGEFKAVKHTPMDFTISTPIGARVNQKYKQLKYGMGYDHNWVLNDYNGNMQLAARVYEPTSGRVMEVLTTEPGVQFYCGNFLDGSNVGKGGKVYNHRNGFCLETQHFPDSPNQSGFPSTILKPGEKYKQKTIYRFSTK
jgi:aldose 1-epimerase